MGGKGWDEVGEGSECPLTEQVYKYLVLKIRLAFFQMIFSLFLFSLRSLSSFKTQIHILGRTCRSLWFGFVNKAPWRSTRSFLP